MHRVWGVSLPKALEKGGVLEGDTVTLRKDGVETVKVEVPVVDPETGAKRFEEREVQRNVWTANLVETAEARQQRIEQESHRPELFKQLVERLSRSGAKSTTLDYESEAGYQAQVVDFARRRNMDHAIELAAGMEAGMERRLSWIGAQRDRLARLWERASIALGLAIEKERSVSYDDQAVRAEPVVSASKAAAPVQPAQQAPICAEMRYLIAPQESFVRSLDEDARIEHVASARWKERETILLPVMERIYRNPAAALDQLNRQASAFDVEPRRLGEDLGRAPRCSALCAEAPAWSMDRLRVRNGQRLSPLSQILCRSCAATPRVSNAIRPFCQPRTCSPGRHVPFGSGAVSTCYGAAHGNRSRARARRRGRLQDRLRFRCRGTIPRRK